MNPFVEGVDDFDGGSGKPEAWVPRPQSRAADRRHPHPLERKALLPARDPGRLHEAGPGLSHERILESDFLPETAERMARRRGASLSRESVLHSDRRATGLKFIRLAECRELRRSMARRENRRSW